MATEFDSNAVAKIRDILDSEPDEGEALRRTLRVLAFHRSTLIANTLIVNGGERVRRGPFAGLRLPRSAAEGCLAPKLLGAYESELHPVIEQIAYRGYRTIVNIGCAEGYYAVGLALRLPEARVLAFDIEESARTAARGLADAHGVGDRVEIGGEFTTADFASLDPGETFVFCDIEGAEIDLLVPDKAPNLRKLDILVELHNVPEIGINRRMLEAFRPTHRLDLIETGARDIRDFPDLRTMEHLDQLLAFWEHRRGPTPWVLMMAKET
ncbi:unnamed protein product [Chrysoparadoxa australica]